MSLWVIAAGILGGLGIFIVIRELAPAPARLDAALARLDHVLVRGPARTAGPAGRPAGRLAQRVAAGVPWLPVPTADLTLLGQDRETWIASKIACGLAGLAVPLLLAVPAAPRRPRRAPPVRGAALDRAVPAGPRDRDRGTRRHRRHRGGRRSRGSQDPGHPGRPRGLDARPGAGRRPGQGRLAQHHDGDPDRAARRRVPAVADLPRGLPHVRAGLEAGAGEGSCPMDPMLLYVRYLLDRG